MMNIIDRLDSFADEREELIQERNAERRYQRELNRHPDPRDPDYPGTGDEEGEA